MLIVCPSCASEYMIDPGRLGAEGRTVRCAKCKGTWFVTPEAEEPEAAPDGGPESEAAVDNAGADAWEQFSNAPLEAEQDAAPASEADNGRKAVMRATGSRSGAPARRLTASGLLPALAILVLGGSAFWGRAHVVRALPATAALYASIGLPVNLRGLEFRAIRSELVVSGTDTVLVVEGEIANISGRDAPVPPIEVGVRGAEGQMLYTWTNDPPRRILGTSDAAHFRARLAAPPVEARQILVRFAAGQDGAAVASHTR